jgi:hypothetical protein
MQRDVSVAEGTGFNWYPDIIFPATTLLCSRSHRLQNEEQVAAGLGMCFCGMRQIRVAGVLWRPVD